MADGYFSNLDGDFFRSPQFSIATNYHGEYDSLDAFLNDGIIGIYDSASTSHPRYKREVRVYYKDNTGYITTIVQYSDNGYDTRDPRFRCYMDTMGMLSYRPIDLAVNDVLTTLGIKGSYNQELMQTIKTHIDPHIQEIYDKENDGVNAIITSDGIFTYFNTFIDVIRSAFLDNFDDYETPIECKYSYLQKNYPEGQSYIVDWDNSKLNDIQSAISFKLNEVGSIPFDSLHEQLQGFAESDDDIKAILNCPNVRTYVRTTDTYVHYGVCGWGIENSSIVTTSHQGYQTYGLNVTSMKWVRFTSSTSSIYQNPPIYPTLTKLDSGTWSGSVGVTINNLYNNYSQVNHGGMPFGQSGVSGLDEYCYYFDSMGFIADTKPYEVLPNAIIPDRSKTLDENYPEWHPIDDEPIRPVTPDTTIQVFVGVPPINISYPLPPIINRPIIEVIEVNAPPTNIVIPQNSDYGLFKIYLPSNTVMSEVTGNLWSPSILERIQRIFKNNPMDAVISLHEIYLSGLTVDSIKESTQDKVYFGNVPMTATANCDWTKQRYIELNFGALPIKLDFNDYRDYQRDISIFLPFIGFQSLNIMDFTGKGTTNIELKYVCDILTGDVIANLYISKDGLTDKKFMYTYSGNMSSVLPLSANDKSRLFGNVGSALGSVATALVTGGKSAIASSIIGGGTNIATGSQSSVQRSGSISGNTGAMNYKRAFLLINNPRPLDVSYNDLSGYSTNLKARLSSLTGYARIKECHVDTLPNASDVEKNMIESLLKTGVIF